MENYYQGKYFSFFNILSNQVRIIKYKRKEEEFYAANTIWDARIISNLLFELNFDDKKISQVELKTYSEKIDISFLENFYYKHEKVNFLVFNKEYSNFTFSFIVINEHKNIFYYNETEFLKTDPYKTFKFSLEYAGQYKILFYIDNIFQYHSLIKIKDNNLSKYSLEVEEDKNKIKFRFIPDDYENTIKIRYWNLNNCTENYDTSIVESEENLEELYVPLSELFSKDIKENEFQRFLKITLEDKYNAMGIMKIIHTLKVMHKKDEVQFVENLFKGDKELAVTIMEIIFDFDVLFLISANDARGILNLVDNYMLAVALKGETKNRIEQIRKYFSEKRWEDILVLFDRIETIEIKKTDIAQKKIGTIIRSYYQKKYGMPFIFETKKKNRRKIRRFELSKNEEIILPELYYNGYYVIEFFLRNESAINIIHKVTGKEMEYRFDQKVFFSTGEFFEIKNIDKNNVHLRFKKRVKKCMIVLPHGKEMEFQEFSGIFNDEIISVRRPGNNLFRMIIGTINQEKEHPVDEADVLINLYKIEENRIFVPDSIMCYEEIPVKILDEEKKLFYIKQKDIPVSIVWNRFKDLLEIDKKENMELSNEKINDIIIQEIKDADSIQNYVYNNFNSVTLSYIKEDELNHQISGIYSVIPVIARVINNILYVYNLTDSPFTLSIFQDEQNIFNETIEAKYYEFNELEKEKKAKVHIRSSVGEYIYYFIPSAQLEKYDLKKKYNIRDENYEKVLWYMHQLHKRHIINLIIELKIYRFKYKETKQRIFKNMLEMILNKLKREYYKQNYFVYTPESEFNTLDIVDILLHLQEIYKKGLNQLDQMIETTFAYLKKIKFKDKRLKDYTKQKKFKLFGK